MKTVPTLCATATVVGASAVGLSFGREAPLDAASKNQNKNKNKHQNKTKATPAQELDHRPMPSQVQTQPTTTTAQHHSGPVPLPAPSRLPFAARLSYDGRPRRIVRRMTSTDPPLQPQHGYTPSTEHDIDERDPAALASSRRASWIQRLSTISTSQASSRNTSPGPLSPSVSCSNGSMAFSHDGSTAPMIGEQPPPPMPPNKLVKRSSSVHVFREASAPPSASLRPSFRRPATSHQRSATLQHQTALLEMMAENPSMDALPLPPSTDSDIEYAQFFTARVADDKTLGKRKGSLVHAKALKRIYPDETHKPTLLLATSVSAGAGAEVDESASEDGESMFFVSRPGTPLSFTAVIATQNEMPHDLKTSRGRPSVDDDAARPRRSFSIADFLSPGSSAKKQRTARLPGASLARRLSQRRVSSAPLPTMAKRQSSTAHGEPSASSARRDLTDPTLGRRNISTSAGVAHSEQSRHDLSEGLSSSPLPASARRGPGKTMGTPASMQRSDATPLVSTSTNQTPPSPILAQTGIRPSRHSMAPSEQASTLVGSDNEARGVGTGDEDDADVQSETVFDSLRTGATRSTAGHARGPRIETIFDESPPSKVKVTALRDLLPKGTFREQTADAAPGQHSIAEEEESISTPVRTVVPDRSTRDSPTFSRGPSAPLFPNLIPSSPPDMPKPLSLGTLEWDARAGDDDSSSHWSVEQQDEDSWSELPSRLPLTLFATPVSFTRPSPRLFASGTSPKPATPQHLNIDHGDRDARSSIFDWSEQQPTDNSSGNRTPPRPSTVHGKKDADRRGSRSVGRRAPSGLHARSQSVPVVPDATGKRNTVVTNKFGTWGVGSKGVTEDWNDDFDFSEIHEEPSAEGTAESQRVDSGTVMVVPNHIQQQQSNVLANIGLLREWGLLIEELKEQRVRAAALGIVAGPRASMWEEVDAMIDLADQEVEHEGLPSLSPPSSPAFDEDAFDDLSGPSPSQSRETRRLGLASEGAGKLKNTNNSHLSSQPARPRRKSILPPNYHFQGPQSSPVPPKSKFESPAPPVEPKVIHTRPRKDSEAKARSVIEALQNRKSTQEPLADAQPPSPTKKVPFDTATLRRIVPYVNTLTRRVKGALRDAEGIYSSPSTSASKDTELPISKMFQTDNDLPKQMKLMTVM